MRNALIITLGIFLFASPQAYGTYLAYIPEEVSFEIAAGADAQFQMTVTLNDMMPGTHTYRLWFANAVSDGNLPIEWITAFPANTFLNEIEPSGNTTVSIQIPQGTSPGMYSNILYSRGFCFHLGDADRGDGVSIRVEVPQGCSGVPEISITSFAPEYIWPQRKTPVSVTISGNITLPGGCTLLDTGCSIEDEYDVYTSIEPIAVNANGSFSVSFPVEARRAGGDDDGRTYIFTIFARDENGTGTTDGLVTTVAHSPVK